MNLQEFRCELSILTTNDLDIGIDLHLCRADVWRALLGASLVASVIEVPYRLLRDRLQVANIQDTIFPAPFTRQVRIVRLVGSVSRHDSRRLTFSKAIRCKLADGRRLTRHVPICYGRLSTNRRATTESDGDDKQGVMDFHLASPAPDRTHF